MTDSLTDAADAMMQAFLARLAARLGQEPYAASGQPPQERVAGILAYAKQIYADNADRITDRQSESHLKFCSTLLATYESFREQEDDSGTAVADLDEILVQPFRDRIEWWLDIRFGVNAQTADKAFETMALNFVDRGAGEFGESFDYVQEAKDETRSLVQIKKCFFNSFFRDNGAPEITPVLCAMDMVWADRINEGPYNTRFERPSLMSMGDDACRFYFYRR